MIGKWFRILVSGENEGWEIKRKIMEEREIKDAVDRVKVMGRGKEKELMMKEKDRLKEVEGD